MLLGVLVFVTVDIDVVHGGMCWLWQAISNQFSSSMDFERNEPIVKLIIAHHFIIIAIIVPSLMD